MASRIIEVFQGLEDPRKSNATKHDFAEMLTSGVIAVICGYETCVDMESFSKANRDFLGTFLELKHDIPSHDAFSRLLRILDADAFQESLLKLVDMFNRHLPESVSAVDKNSLIQKFNQPSRKSAIYLLNVFGLSVRAIFGQFRDSTEQKITTTEGSISPYLQQFCTAVDDET